MLNLDVIYDVTIAIKCNEIILMNKQFIQLLPCQVSLNSLYSTSICLWPKTYSFRVAGVKAIIDTDHRAYLRL